MTHSFAIRRSVENIGGIPSVVSQIGEVNESHVCVIVIPGNPGAIEFYDIFIEHLFHLSKGAVAILGIAHAGHSPVWCYQTDVTNWNEGNCKDVEDQVRHKECFIQSLIPKEKKLILIGHSVGCYIALQLLKNTDIADRVVRTVLLFPTIERIANTPNGYFWDPVSRYFRWFFSYVSFFLSLSPTWVKNMAIDWRTSWKGRVVPQKIRDHCTLVMDYYLMNNALIMAKAEMDEIKDLDDSVKMVIKERLQSLTFYYGITDRWAPLDFYYRMREMFPGGDIRLCSKGFEHDFVLDGSAGVAQIAWDIIVPEL